MRTDLDVLKNAIKITDLAATLGLQIKNKTAHCFKHQDRTPSLSFDTKANRFKCFSCNISGSIIDLYKEIRGVNVSEAIDELIKMTNLTQGQKRVFMSQKPQEQGKVYSNPIYTPKATQKPITDAIAGIYKALLDFCGELDETSRAYLMGATRGLIKETIARFKLFCIKDYTATNKFMQKKFSLEALKEAGLVSEAGNLIFYQHKIIIPFIESNRIIFLQARRMDDQQPKYMHLKKRSVPLFNAEILKSLAKGEKVYLCEGVFDAMMLDQAGFKATAILGVNNFKPEMAGLYGGLDIVLCLDNDESGRRRTQTIANIFLTQGQSVKRKLLPDGVKDITEWYIK
jgi:DNA primase catalytic core